MEKLAVGSRHMTAVSWQLAAIPNFLLQTANSLLPTANCKLSSLIPQ
jgi:hypothetical protein